MICRELKIRSRVIKVKSTERLEALQFSRFEVLKSQPASASNVETSRSYFESYLNTLVIDFDSTDQVLTRRAI